ncbi:MAG: hypothetical protein Q9219_006160 [cf. Caloplaca sp. 3 TL-2023]
MKQTPNFASKFSATATQGKRLLPTKGQDPKVEVRIDAGYYDPVTKGLNVILQVNSEAKSPALVKWRKKNSSHGKLATATFNTDADDKDAEANRVIEELETEAREKLG